jgi:hypothetical protein
MRRVANATVTYLHFERIWTKVRDQSEAQRKILSDRALRLLMVAPDLAAQ